MCDTHDPSDAPGIAASALCPAVELSISRVSAGSLQAGYTLFVAGRSAHICIIRDGELLPNKLSLDGIAVGLAACGHTLIVAQTCCSLALYNAATFARRATVALPSAPLALAALPHPTASLAAVALRDCAVLLFNGSTIVSRHETSAPVLGLYGGAMPAIVASLHACKRGLLPIMCRVPHCVAASVLVCNASISEHAYGIKALMFDTPVVSCAELAQLLCATHIMACAQVHS